MSCPSWDRLVAHRYAGPGEREPEGWREALEHLDWCPACREAAYAADPTLVLRRQQSPRFDADEVSRMRAGVDALRHARRLEEGSPAPAAVGTRQPWPEREASRWSALASGISKLAAAAGLAAILLSAHPDGGTSESNLLTTTAEPLELQALVPPPGYDSWGSDLAATDDFYLSTATVYHFDDEDLNVVMVVDAELDV